MSLRRKEFNVNREKPPPMPRSAEGSPVSNQREFQDMMSEFDNEKPEHAKYMLEFLTNKCEFRCDSICIDAHGDQSVRRRPYRLKNGAWNYFPQMCLAGEHCEFASKCMYSHNLEEIKYHPMIFKTQICAYKIIDGECIEHGPHCPMAHGDQRIGSRPNIDDTIEVTYESNLVAQIEANRINLENYSTYKSVSKNHIKVYTKPIKGENFDIETFKTRYCSKKYSHDEKSCTFYHNDQDKRRKTPYLYEPCPNIYNKALDIFELKLCPEGESCKFSHSIIEIQYHPDKYKTELCILNPCDLGERCPYIHPESTLTLEEQKKELESLIERHAMLSSLLENTKRRYEKLKKFVCVHESKMATAVLTCGHLICSGCLSKPKCPICNVPVKKMKITVYNN